jgi:4-hydroxy-tetrahydrodipicolinate synthase
MLKGSLVALITPFLESEELDLDCFRELIDWHIQETTDGIVVCGTTGEAPTLSQAEQIDLLRAAVEQVQGRIPVIMGTGSNDTKTACIKTQEAKANGADAALVIVPYYNKPSFEGCLHHFQRVARVGLPIVIYHHPGRTSLKFTATQLVELCQIPGVIGLKESSGDLDLIAEFMHTSSTPVFSGDDTLTLPMVAMGASGSISVAANAIPKKWRDLVSYCLKDDFILARQTMRHLLPFCKTLFLDTNPQGIKYAMSLIGKCQPFLRSPLIQSNPLIQSTIQQALETLLLAPQSL